MAIELGWDEKQKKTEYQQASDFLLTMGLSIKDRLAFPGSLSGPDSVLTKDEARFFKRTYFTPAEIEKYRALYKQLDLGHKFKRGSIEDALKKLEAKISQEEIHRVLEELEYYQGSMDFALFLEILADVKDNRSYSKFARVVADYEDRKQYPTERSGGGV
jgi:glycerol-3-phosphate dehydrogenase